MKTITKKQRINRREEEEEEEEEQEEAIEKQTTGLKSRRVRACNVLDR